MEARRARRRAREVRTEPRPTDRVQASTRSARRSRSAYGAARTEGGRRSARADRDPAGRHRALRGEHLMFSKKDPEMAARIPPGQHLTRGWPVLSASPVPPFDPATWRFRCTGMCDGVEFSWDEFRALPSVTLTNDIHCVTAWSKLDNVWDGVLFKEVAARAGVKPEATHALLKAPYGD